MRKGVETGQITKSDIANMEQVLGISMEQFATPMMSSGSSEDAKKNPAILEAEAEMRAAVDLLKSIK